MALLCQQFEHRVGLPLHRALEEKNAERLARGVVVPGTRMAFRF
jgi:hypothetical protein